MCFGVAGYSAVKPKCYVANILFVFLVARPLTGGELMVLNFLGKRSTKRTTTGILLIFLFLETFCDFFQLGQFVRDTGR